MSLECTTKIKWEKLFETVSSLSYNQASWSMRFWKSPVSVSQFPTETLGLGMHDTAAFHMGFRDQTQAVGLCGRGLDLLSYLSNPASFIISPHSVCVHQSQDPPTSSCSVKSKG